MNKRLLIRFLKYLYKLSIPIIAIICLIKYWCVELIVDKFHYGLFMIVMLILMLDNTNGGNNKAAIS